MLKRVPWFFASLLLVLSLLLTSCGKTSEDIGSGGDVPKYGGTLNLVAAGDPMGFDEAFNAPWFVWPTHLTEDEMLNGDWTQGWAGGNGSKKWTWTLDGIYNWSSKAGSVCESWQAVSPYHYTFKVRKGIKFSLDPNNEASKLVNGRELTADDVVYSYNRECTVPQSYIVAAHPQFVKAIKMTATDKYSIDLVVPNDPDSIYQIAQIVVDWNGVIAKEVIDKWGDMKDWKRAHGTGPFMLTDFVSGSAVTFIRNKNYWDKDPIGPGKGNQLPYVDTVKVLVITDLSSRLAALRTAKIEAITGIGIDDAKSVKQTTPKLSVFEIPAALAANQIFMRTDKKDLPYSNKKVRQALIKATDYKTIVNTLFDGKAVYPTLPCPPLPDLKDVVLPLSEASQAAQDLYVYDPAKAKQMLSEAGYPSGFKAQIFAQNTEANIDYLSVIKEMWSKVGVDLTITPLELAVYNNRWNARNYDELFYGGMASPGTFRSMVSTQGFGGGYNLSYIEDPRLAEGKIKMMDMFASGDDVGLAKLHRQLSGYIYEDAWAVSTPAQTSTSFWWPWMKNYHGETAVGILNTWGWTKWVWLDSDLKKSMGY